MQTERKRLHGSLSADALQNGDFYLPENRYADTVYHIECRSETRFDWDIIGYTVGRMLPSAGVPVLTGDFHRPTLTMLKQCFTAMATTSACELCHIVGVTPEARSLEDARGNKPLRGEFTITQKDYDESCRQICSAGEGKINFVLLGCPHYSLEDIQQVANYIHGKKWRKVWNSMSGQICPPSQWQRPAVLLKP